MSNLSSVVDSIFSIVDWTGSQKHAESGWSPPEVLSSGFIDPEQCEGSLTGVSSLGMEVSSNGFSRQSMVDAHERDHRASSFANGRPAYDNDAKLHQVPEEHPDDAQFHSTGIASPGPSMVAALSALAEMQSHGFGLQSIQNLLNYIQVRSYPTTGNHEQVLVEFNRNVFCIYCTCESVKVVRIESSEKCVNS